MTLGTVTTLAQIIPVIVLSGAVVGLTKSVIPKEEAVKSFSEASYVEAVDAFGKNDADVARKNPDTIFHTNIGDIMYTDGRYFVR